MSRFGRLLICIVCCHCSALYAQALQNGLSPKLGSAAPIDAETLLVLPNGFGLPPGQGTASQGKEVYTLHCMACHGVDGTSGIKDVLVGGHGSLTEKNPVRTVGSYWPYATTIFDFVRRAMPYQAPGLLSDDELYAVTAYVLYLNELVELDESVNREVLTNLKMPNRDGFVWAVPDS